MAQSRGKDARIEVYQQALNVLKEPGFRQARLFDVVLRKAEVSPKDQCGMATVDADALVSALELALSQQLFFLLFENSTLALCASMESLV